MSEKFHVMGFESVAGGDVEPGYQHTFGSLGAAEMGAERLMQNTQSRTMTYLELWRGNSLLQQWHREIGGDWWRRCG